MLDEGPIDLFANGKFHWKKQNYYLWQESLAKEK